MEVWVTLLWVIGGLFVLFWIILTAVFLYLIKKIGFRNLRLLLTSLVWIKAYLRYRDRFFR